jgi:hypothetical protein
MKTNLAPKVTDILQNAAKYHDSFYSGKPFGGPSLHFHRRALGLNGTVTLRDQTELVYAVLSSWGMHRMGRGGSKMRPYVDVLKSIRTIRGKLTKAASLTPGKLTPSDWPLIYDIFRGIKVMASGTTIVGNSKVMAHLLPNIVPPIDREYTLNYLFGSGNLQNDLTKEWDLMKKILTEFFYPIAADSAFAVQATTWMAAPAFPWDTSPLKVIDNLLIGAMK